MKVYSVVATGLVLALFTSCSTSHSSTDDSPQVASGEKRASIPWWRQLNDSALNQDVSAAFASNPGLRAVALRIEQADAAVASARASTLPRLNLGFGYREGRKQQVDLGPYDLAPRESGGQLSWEIDISGKLRAAKKSALENQAASVWDFHSARLLLASRIAATRMNLYRFNAELSDLANSLLASQGTLNSLTERSQAGLISDSILEKQRAENERLLREKLDLKRLRDLTLVQLRALRGGTNPKGITRVNFPSPAGFSSRPLNELLASHPGILAAEARVRSAFQLEKSARLDLLPSFQFNALATGNQKNLTDRFRTWSLKAGPSLDIPIYDPVRLAAVQTRKSQSKISAAQFQQTVLDILEEVGTARINFTSHRAQVAAASRETKALERTRNHAREQFDAGLTSQIEYLDTERRWLDAKRSQASLRQAMLNAQINFIRATGGGRL
ncbi:MAG: outer membrane protein TolC [Akkermansiaceae bacterium]|jgi:outer membrane protein TolC